MHQSTHGSKNRSHRIRPKFIHLGVDDAGRAHCYNTSTESVHVVSRDGGRPYRLSIERDDDLEDVDEYIEKVARRCGWCELEYGWAAFLDRFAEAV